MIQRRQTLYLLAGAIVMAGIYFLDEIRILANGGSSWFTAVTLGVFGICVVGAIVAVFLYKDRKRQRSVVLLLQVFTLLGVITLFTGEYLGGTLPFVGPESAGVEEGIGMGLAVVGYVLFYLARRGIEKDIELLRSVDRLR